MGAAPSEAVASAPTERRGAIDVARILALSLVVLGHLSLAVIDRDPDGELRGANLLGLHPGWVWLAAAAPMPVFFAAAGWANSTSTVASAAPRLRTLVGLGAVVVVTWSVAAGITVLVNGEAGIVAKGARIATQPLWFLAAYVPFAACGRRITRLAARPVVALGACLGLLVVLDVARFGLDAPEILAWPGFFVAWGVPWLLGAWWRARSEAGGLDERRVGAVLAATAAAAGAMLVWLMGYHPALIDVVSGERSNTTPPTLYTAVIGIAQVGVLMVSASWLDRLAVRRRRQLDRAGLAAVGVYVWHLTALVLCGAAIAAGLWAPERLTPAWWATRPLWFAAVLGLTGVLVVATDALRGRLTARTRPATTPTFDETVLWAGVLTSTFGAGVIGLEGPATSAAAIAASASLVAGWWLLGARPRHQISGTQDAAAPSG